jgi:hypothetical protein
MLFLMNEVVLNLDAIDLTPPVAARRFARLTMPFVNQLAAEMFSEEPLLHRVAPDRARRLAALIIAKQPDINAALFIAPGRGCRIEQVQSRFCARQTARSGVAWRPEDFTFG